MVQTIKVRVIKSFIEHGCNEWYLDISFYNGGYRKEKHGFLFHLDRDGDKVLEAKTKEYYGISDVSELKDKRIDMLWVENGIVWGFKHPNKDKFLISVSGIAKIHEFSLNELEDFVPKAIADWELRLKTGNM